MPSEAFDEPGAALDPDSQVCGFNSLGADGREAGDAPRQGPHLPGNRVERPLFLFWSWILRLKN